MYHAGEIDLFENLDIVHIRLLVALSLFALTGMASPDYFGFTVDAFVPRTQDVNSRTVG